MPNIIVEKNRYTVDPLYQWDLNQELHIYGLSLPYIPEIHFTNEAMDRAIVRQSTVNDSGVITVTIPNSLLQKPYKITAYVCIYEGKTFRSLYKIILPVVKRNQPSDYIISDADGEVYSFKALENRLDNIITELATECEKLADKHIAKAENDYDKSQTNLAKAIERYNKAYEELQGYTEKVDAVIYNGEQILSESTKTELGLSVTATPNDIFGILNTLITNKFKIGFASYVGTGTFGQDNACRLTFDFVPKIVFYVGRTVSGSGSQVGYESDAFDDNAHFYNVIFCDDLNEEYVSYRGFCERFSKSNGGYTEFRYAKKSTDGMTIYWYTSLSGADIQLNDAGDTYRFIAIG